MVNKCWVNTVTQSIKTRPPFIASVLLALYTGLIWPGEGKRTGALHYLFALATHYNSIGTSPTITNKRSHDDSENETDSKQYLHGQQKRVLQFLARELWLEDIHMDDAYLHWMAAVISPTPHSTWFACSHYFSHYSGRTLVHPCTSVRACTPLQRWHGHLDALMIVYERQNNANNSYFIGRPLWIILTWQFTIRGWLYYSDCIKRGVGYPLLAAAFCKRDTPALFVIFCRLTKVNKEVFC